MRKLCPTLPSLRSAWIAGLLVLAGSLSTPVHAARIAAWDFDAGNAADQSGSATAHDLATVGTGTSFAGGALVLDGNEANPSYLEVTGPGGNPNWTISLSLRSDIALDQGLFQGIFSNNHSSTANYSWQLESHNGRYQWRNATGTFDVGVASGVGAWDHIVIRKFGGGDGDIWFNGVQVLSSIGGNPGGLQNFRLGTNRNTSHFWSGAIDNVEVYDSFEDAASLYAAVPELHLSGALGIAGLFLAGRKRRE